MKKISLLVLVLALSLTACSANPQRIAPAATEAEVRTQPAGDLTPAAAQTEAAATEAPTGVVEASEPAAMPDTGGLVIYNIVPGESNVAYEVGETLFSQNNRFNVAIGTTSQVKGEIQLDPANPQNTKIGTIEVDISQFQSDSGRRDGTIRGRFLESSKYPIVTFAPTSIEGLPQTYTPGQEISFKVTGDATVRNVTRPVTFDVTAKLDGDQLTGTAAGEILMSDFSFGPIQIAGMLGTEDKVKLTLSFVARP